MNSPFVKTDSHLRGGEKFTRALTRKEVGENIKKGTGAFMKKANFIVVFAVILLLYVISSLAMQGTFSWGLFTNIFQSATIVGIIGVGMAIIIIMGQIDLSVGSTLALVGGLDILVFNAALESSGSLGAAAIATFVASIVLGVVCGFVNGFFIGVLKMPSFIVTLATMLAFRSIILYVLSFQKDPSGAPASTFRLASYTQASGNPLYTIGNYVPFAEITLTSIIFILIVVAIWLIMTYTKFGRKVFAVGSNPKAASLVGIKPAWMIIKVFVIEGALVGFAAFIHVCMRGNVDAATTGAKFEMYAIASAVLGGISMTGGRGSILGVLFGAAAYDAISKIILALGLPFQINDAIKGAILIIAIIFQVVKYNRQEVIRFLQKLHLAYVPNKGLLLESELKRKIEAIENKTNEKVKRISIKTSDEQIALELIKNELEKKDAKILELKNKYKVLIFNANVKEAIHDNDTELNARIANITLERQNNNQFYTYLEKQAKEEAAPALAPFYHKYIELQTDLLKQNLADDIAILNLKKGLGISQTQLDEVLTFNQENTELVNMSADEALAKHDEDVTKVVTATASIDEKIEQLTKQCDEKIEQLTKTYNQKADAVVAKDKIALEKYEANAPAREEKAKAKADKLAAKETKRAERKAAKEEKIANAKAEKEEQAKVLAERLKKLSK